VRPTSSVLRYGDENANPLEAGRELGVDFVLDGRIKRAGERIRVSLQLLDVRQGASAWAQQFDESFTDALSLEDAVAAQVAEALVPQLTGEERRRLKKRGTDDPEAFEAYLRGRYHLNTYTEEGFAKAIVAYHQAAALDPHYALPYAGIADYYNWLAVYGVMPPNECYRAAIQAAVKAIELDSGLSEAYAALGFAVLVGNYDWARGEEACRRAIELNPHNAQAHVWYSLQLTMEGRFDEGISYAKRGIELDPHTPFNAHNLGWCLYFARRFDESVEQYRRVIAAHPLYPLAHYGLSWTLRYTGGTEEALSEAKRSVELSNESLMLLFLYGQAQAAAGLRREAEETVARLTALAAERHVSFYNVALIHCFLGESEKAFECLERAYAERDAWLVWLGVEPMFDGLRDDPRFSALLQKTNNPGANNPAVVGSGQRAVGSEQF
jgi:tetratricopeptide (TPR) repeat protein